MCTDKEDDEVFSGSSDSVDGGEVIQDEKAETHVLVTSSLLVFVTGNET